jgi:hypothetical protein
MNKDLIATLTDGKYPIKAHLNNIEGLIALTGGLIIIFM